MSKAVVTIEATATVGQAARLLAAHLMSCLIVVEDGQPVGVLTERDIAVCAAAERTLDAIPVGDVMGSPLESVGPQDTLADVVRRLAGHGMRHAPVVSEAGALLGRVAHAVLLRAFAALGRVLPLRR